MFNYSLLVPLLCIYLFLRILSKNFLAEFPISQRTSLQYLLNRVFSEVLKTLFKRTGFNKFVFLLLNKTQIQTTIFKKGRKIVFSCSQVKKLFSLV